MNCPCGNNTEYKNCCEPYIEGQKKPDTAEKLMRARYTAYVQSKVDYLLTTLAPESRSDFDLNAAKQWAKTAKWKGLKIISTEKGGPDDSTGTVEFIATYAQGKESLDHHEVSKFRKSERGEWFFLDGDSHTHKEGEEHHHHVKPQTVIREEAKIGRNDPCTCGSGKKYKKCCGVEA